MADLDLGAYLSNDVHVLRRVPSERYPAPEGKDYRVPSLSAKDALKLRAMQSFAGGDLRKILTSSAHLERTLDFCGVKDTVDPETGKPEQRTYNEKVLGQAVYDEMIEDGVSEDALERIVGMVTLIAAQGEAVAGLVVDEAGKAMVRANRADKREATRAAKKAPAKAAGRRTASRGRADSPQAKPARRDGSSSSRASGDASSPATPARRTTTSRSPRAASAPPVKRTATTPKG